MIFFKIFRFAKKNDLPMLEHCTLPRTGALEVILDILGPNQKNGFSANSSGGNSLQLQDDSKIGKIFDVTIAYPEGKPLDLFQIGFGSRPPCVTHVHYRVFDVKDVSFLSASSIASSSISSFVHKFAFLTFKLFVTIQM